MCLFGESSQQASRPQVVHSRRCTQVLPIARHASHTRTSGTSVCSIVSRCVQVALTGWAPLGRLSLSRYLRGVTGNLLVFLGAALASAVEMVETLTIVLALGVSRGWRAPLQGAAAALVVLAVLVAALGRALEAIPLDLLRLVVGALLLVFGLQWLRKAI